MASPALEAALAVVTAVGLRDVDAVAAVLAGDEPPERVAVVLAQILWAFAEMVADAKGQDPHELWAGMCQRLPFLDGS